MNCLNKFNFDWNENNAPSKNLNQIGWLDTYENILNYLKLNERVIDMLKIDIEGNEWEALVDIMDTNPKQLCKYVKQMAIETHSRFNLHETNFRIIKSIEVCFRLYKRDHRFYLTNSNKSEWQLGNFSLPLSKYKDEIELARALFLYGELYFINKNFL